MTFESILRIRPGEGRRAALLFTHLALASAVFYLGRTVRDTLFLSRYPLSSLPWMFVVYGAASSVVALGWARLADRMPRQRQIAATCAAGVLTFVGAWLMVRADAGWIYPVFYVWTDIISALLIVQFWTLANDLTDARTAKRLYGVIGSARLLAAVVVGLVAGAVVRSIGTAQLILVLAGLMIAIVAVAAAAGRPTGEVRVDRAEAPPHRRGRTPRLLGDPYLKSLAILLLAAFTAVNIGDYQFKAMARAAWSEDQLAGFFALFYAATGAISFLFQLFVTPRILARAGVGAGMTIMPASFGLASAGLMAWPSLGWATMVKFADNGFQFTIQETTFQALYVPFPTERKVRSRAYLESVVKPLGIAAAGVVVLLATLGGISGPAQLSFITIPLVLIWLGQIPRVRRLYLRELESTLSARGAFALDQEFQLDAAGRRSLVRALSERHDSRQILAALEQLGEERSDEVREAIIKLTRHEETIVRRAALDYLAEEPGTSAAAIRDSLHDPEPSVRAAAALALGAAARDDAVDPLVTLLADEAQEVHVAALAALLKYGGVEGGIVGGVELGRLLQSTRREDLVSAARALGHLGPGAYRPLRRLLDDSDPAVRRAAIRAAPGVADPRLVPVLLHQLTDPAVRRRAGNALVAIGAPSVGGLGQLLGDAAIPRAVRLEVPRLLRRIPVPHSYDVLHARTNDNDSRLRLRIYAAMGTLRHQLLLGPPRVAELQAMVARELREARGNDAAWEAARSSYPSRLLEEMFAVRRTRVVRRVLRLLELRYDPASLRLVRDHLAEPLRRANALEVLDTLLDAPLRRELLPYLESTADPAPASFDPTAFMLAHARHPNPYFALLALDALARQEEPEAVPLAESLREHPDPLVREGARLVLKEATSVYSTVEKILLLKSAPVFERVTGEDLAPLARVAEAEVYAPGAVIMKEGDPGDSLLIVVRGRVAVTRNERPLNNLGPGDSMGEMSVLDRAPRSATATAVEETEVLRIGSEEFYEILHEQVEIAEGVIRVLSTRLRQLDRRLTERPSKPS